MSCARLPAAVLVLLLVAFTAQRVRAEGDDSTLTVEQYVDMGLPAPDRPWRGRDYTVLSEGLSRLLPEQLPASRSARSGAYLDRLVAVENLELCRSASLPLDQRFIEGNQLLLGFRDVLGPYIQAFAKDPRRALDVARIAAFGVRCATLVAGLANEFVSGLDPADPNHATRLEGLRRLRSGLTQVVAGAVQMLTDDLAQEPSARLELARALAECLPAMKGDLPPMTRRELAARLQQVGAAVADDEALAAALKRAAAALAGD
ncbi:MAG: hypothetical protein M9894_12730 [Planctomycetes bacterium]|nr:hypothetical protein [Planctomycetota bacterium]